MKKNIKFLFPLIGFVFIFIIIFTQVIYSKHFNNKNRKNSENNNINIANSTTSEPLIITIDDEENNKNSIQINKSEEQHIEEENLIDESNNNELSRSSTYTFSNGETYNIIGTLNIPSLNINYPILADNSEALLKLSLTKYWGGNANEVGNLCILGHNYKNSKFFGKLLNIQKNAIINLTDVSGRTLEYKVYSTSIVSPEDNTCTSQLTNGNTEITLITCYYENGSKHATKRFVVKARAY